MSKDTSLRSLTWQLRVEFVPLLGAEKMTSQLTIPNVHDPRCADVELFHFFTVRLLVKHYILNKAVLKHNHWEEKKSCVPLYELGLKK